MLYFLLKEASAILASFVCVLSFKAPLIMPFVRHETDRGAPFHHCFSLLIFEAHFPGRLQRFSKITKDTTVLKCRCMSQRGAAFRDVCYINTPVFFLVVLC